MGEKNFLNTRFTAPFRDTVDPKTYFGINAVATVGGGRQGLRRRTPYRACRR